ncbi:PREDICTED: lipase member I isoform X3 [Ceratotherium simum simum]|uniref:Lipase member I isoform X3 n=1 Tax=Ceratotherium simum simum TaxID=73337 RepID=A0ABM0I5H7_CERSS|nr:PREDICTED: lipase member I isoform X3 [Ceratotherium simum simum]
MRVYIFLCLMCWARSESKRPCLEFSQLSVKDSFRDLFVPKMEIFLMMYTRNNPNCAEPLFEQGNSLNVNFNTNKKTVWLIHGYRPMGSTPAWLQNFLRILLTQDDMNVIVVDWNRGATTFIYNRAVKNTRKVAMSLSKCIQNLLKHGASLDNFHFIGVSLGAHISGFVGKLFQGQLGRITGLDPAGPKFSGRPSNGRLDYTDAKFVDVIHSDTNGIEFIKCDHQRAVYLFMAALETNCNFISFPCHSYKAYKTGSCVDCAGFKTKSCPRLGYQAELWKDVLKERIDRSSLRTSVFLDTTGTNPFCTYYFVLSIIVLDKTMKDGYITFKLLNQIGMVEKPRLYEKNKSFYKLQEVKILAQFLNDVVNVSSIGLAYFQSSDQQCSTCKYSIQRLMLKSLTYPERPPLCVYNFVLKESEEVFLNPSTCISKEI